MCNEMLPGSTFRNAKNTQQTHIGTISGPTSMKAMSAVGGMPTFETSA
jgi:hypothetical protein